MKSAHILLVEDNEGDIVLTEEAFESGGLKNKMSVARDGEEALNFLLRRNGFEHTERPDLILLDINLPRVNGLEVLEIIKKEPELKPIPVIILTTSSAYRDIKEAYDKHVNCYIIKPLDLLKFGRAISEIESFWLTLVTAPAVIN